MATYSWLTQTQAVSALQGRLNQAQFWNATELWVYLSEALRFWNAITESWNQDFSISSANGQWINTGTLTGSPRFRTQTDSNLYTQIQYMLLEPPTGGATWTGTSQFSLAQLQSALQKRVQEVIQATACNIAQLSPVAATPGVRRYTLPDTVLEQRRTRFFALMVNTIASAASGAYTLAVASAAGIARKQVISGTGIQTGTFVTGVSGLNVSISLPTSGVLSSTALQFFQPMTLTREDQEAFYAFEPESLQNYGIPQSWSMASEPPLAFDVDYAPNTPGNFDILALNASATFAPPAASLLGIPDDWSWVPLYGALADVLGIESEATDRQRAAYCLERYTQGLDMMKNSNWLLKTTINGAVSRATSLAEMDAYAREWQESNYLLPCVVEAGIDMLAPLPGVGLQVGVTLLGNAPLLDVSNTYVQVSRDDFEAVLNYGQHLASFKQGGSSFMSTTGMLTDFFRAAGEKNKRWLNYGPFVDILRDVGKLQEEASPRG